MIPVKSLRLQLGELLAADATTLAPAANGNKIALINAAFVADENAVIGGLSFADFDGSAPKVCGTGDQQAGIEPATQDQLITMLEPAGGFRWETTGVTNLPQTIYGFALTDNAGAVLLGVEQLDAPVTLTALGQEINLGAVQMRIVTNPIS